MKNSHRSLFITFEGTDGVGKSTQIKLLRAWLLKKGFGVTLTREPGGSPLAEKIRHLILNPKNHIEPLTELFLYEAARIEHIKKVILPALLKGKIVLCDRFADATLAYQGHARGLKKNVLILNALATQGLKPNLTILLDLSPKKGHQNALKRTGKKGSGDRIENEGLKFQYKVRSGYLKLQKEEPNRVKLIQVQNDVRDTQNLIRKMVSLKLHENYRTKSRP
jgi:dTMP kinase